MRSFRPQPGNVKPTAKAATTDHVSSITDRFKMQPGPRIYEIRICPGSTRVPSGSCRSDCALADRGLSRSPCVAAPGDADDAAHERSQV